MDANEHTLFRSEEKAIEEAEKVLKDEQYVSSPLAAPYALLLRQYKSLYKQIRHLIRLSDKQQEKLNSLNRKLEVANNLIRKTFGRYLSDDVVEDILQSSDGLTLGGESRFVTILMSDLRGFTAISEKLPAETVMNIINIYLAKMTDIIMRYNGTIIEFIGDAVFAIFGAPVLRNDDAQRAVACAIEMQRAMAEVNEHCRERGYPEVEQGIGLNTGELIVGNIGSDKRTKYGAVGMQVNLTARVESYTLGGQILISKSTFAVCGPILYVVDQQEVRPKGVEKPVTLYEVRGIGGDFNLYLKAQQPEEMGDFAHGPAVQMSVLEGKHASDETHEGTIIKLGTKTAVIRADMPVERLANLKITLAATGSDGTSRDMYAKVIEAPTGEPATFKMHFTSVPVEVRALLDKLSAEAHRI